jgi:peptidyl-tRNA hydrolase
VGRPPEGWTATDYVLETLSDEELPGLEKAIAATADRVEEVLAQRVRW